MQLRQTGMTWQPVDDEIVVLDLERSVYLKVNGSGRFLWDALTSSTNESELVGALLEQYGIEEAQAARDVAAFVAELRSRHLLVE